MNQANAQVEVQRDRCPFCHDAVRPDQDKTACDACMAWHHKACWADHGGCSACGEGASTAVKPSPKDPQPVQRVVRAIQPPVEGQAAAPRAWMSKAGLVISILTAVFGFSLLSMSYSPQESTSGFFLISVTTPKGFSAFGVAVTLVLTLPLLILGAGFSLGGRQGDRTLANLGLGVSGVYALGLLVSSVMAFG